MTIVEELRGYAQAYTAGHRECPDMPDLAERAAAEIERLQGADDRCELWKSQCAKDQTENRILKARLNGAHVTRPGQVSIDGSEYSEYQLIEFLREAARSAREGTWGMWRAKEFDAAADVIERMYESYLAVCPHERSAEP